MRDALLGLGLVLAVLLACGGERDPEKDRLETCAMYRAQARELARDIRYAEVTPWEAQGKLNRIKDSLKRLDCDRLTPPASAEPPTQSEVTAPKAAPKAARPATVSSSPAKPKERVTSSGNKVPTVVLEED